MGAGQPIKGSGPRPLRPTAPPPPPSSSPSPGIGAGLIGAVKARDEQRNAADSAFRDNDRSNRRKASPNRPPRGIRRPRDPDFRRPGEPFRRPIEDRRPRFGIEFPNRPREPEFRRPIEGRDPWEPGRGPELEPMPPIQRPGPISPFPPRPDREPEIRDRLPWQPGLTPRPEPIFGKEPGRPGIMPIPDKFKDPDGNPYKQPLPPPPPRKEQRDAAENRMRTGGRKGGRR